MAVPLLRDSCQSYTPSLICLLTHACLNRRLRAGLAACGARRCLG